MSDEESKSDLDQNAETPRLNGNAPPPWLASQDVTPAETPKAKRARRTKAQMTEAKVAHATVDDARIETLRPPTFAPPTSIIEAKRVDRLPIIALATALISLAVSCATIIGH